MVIDAIAAGRRAAIAIDKYLKGDTSRVEIYDLKAEVSGEQVAQELEESWEIQPRLAVPALPVQNRRTSFDEVELCFPEDKARKEARRCLRCDLES
jgi:NADH-quinone oxidoreductase subunit F